MTRLLNPGPGEILDRLSILELKIDAAKKKNVASEHFEAEKLMLEERLQHFDDCLREDCVTDYRLWEEKKEKIAIHRNSLAAVNALLWKAEDDARATSENEAFKLASLCKRICSWNDGRARHVRELDKLYGVEEGPEKLHMVTDIELGK